ncbi:MAG: hypothetical protein ACAI44_28930 [Candidatus Sericytochromatia bacterium]
MSNTCCLNACSWFQQNFRFDVEESAQGVKLSIDTKDPAKASALQNLVKSAKAFCQAFCQTGNP